MSIFHLSKIQCKQATLLIEKQSMHKLSFVEKLKLRAHLKLCNLCTRYKKQSEWLNKLLQKIWQSQDASQEETDDLKERIIHKIEEQSKS